jgi:hypothetical protein
MITHIRSQGGANLMGELSGGRPRVLLAFNQAMRDDQLTAENAARLDARFNWFWLRLEGGERQGPNEDPGI